ncbi:hypothetical protein BDP81DRAFT_70311 [Colletotrichum phormii]|uniref:Uncharacterized protein n=1 Tax=Colletotrichum phormii TaxID=359342 RepID=A0AAI9ZL69_9PEZI|nr:uncharacterized protein BDP81DRAFT_70311 [Colletotrichum phormii]KAK1633726.1 hypothetical protein BDP81DRAFT_70311 [Colletotrichum phormii]
MAQWKETPNIDDIPRHHLCFGIRNQDRNQSTASILNTYLCIRTKYRGYEALRPLGQDICQSPSCPPAHACTEGRIRLHMTPGLPIKLERGHGGSYLVFLTDHSWHARLVTCVTFLSWQRPNLKLLKDQQSSKPHYSRPRPRPRLCFALAQGIPCTPSTALTSFC